MGYIDIPFADWISLPRGKDLEFLFCNQNFSDDCHRSSQFSQRVVYSSDMKLPICLTILTVTVVFNFQEVEHEVHGCQVVPDFFVEEQGQK